MSPLPAAPVLVSDIAAVMEQIAPLSLSESWDNTGLLLGDLAAPVERLMTCLTLTGDSVSEAVERSANLGHQSSSAPVQATQQNHYQFANWFSSCGNWPVMASAYTVHIPPGTQPPTASNAQLARKLSLEEIEPLVPAVQSELGAGRCGRLHKPASLEKIVSKLTQAVPHCRPRAVAIDREIRKVAFGCGSGGKFCGSRPQPSNSIY